MFDPHVPVVVFARPWRRLFRKSYAIRCLHCGLRMTEPATKAG